MGQSHNGEDFEGKATFLAQGNGTRKMVLKN